MPNVANRQYVLWPVAIPTIVPILNNTTGYQLQLFVPRHVIQYIDTDPTGQNPPTRTTIDVPPVIVTMLNPVTTPTINLDPSGLSPYPNVLSASAIYPFCSQTFETQNANGTWGQAVVSSVSEPTGFRPGRLGGGHRAWSIPWGGKRGHTGSDVPRRAAGVRQL